MKHEELTGRIIKCAMTVHSTLGNGFQEVIYQRTLGIEMQLEGLNSKEKKKCPLFTAIM